MTWLKVNVTYHPGVGYVSVANHAVVRSLAALSLEGLRRKVLVVTALRRRVGEKFLWCWNWTGRLGLRSSGWGRRGCDRPLSVERGISRYYILKRVYDSF
jgi:hypothetical protein